MEFRAEYKNAKVSPKKARDVAREIQGMQVSEAINTLTFTPRKAARFLNKTLKSAVANATNISEVKEVSYDNRCKGDIVLVIMRLHPCICYRES